MVRPTNLSMRCSFRQMMLWGSAICASPVALIGGESPPPAAVHTWKAMADWYRPDLGITKITPRLVEQSELRIQFGDDVRWAASDWDDRAWAVIDRTQVPIDTGIFWLRVRVRTVGHNEPLPSLVMIADAASQDIYWDGILIHSAGVPGNSRETQVGGVNTIMFELPSQMTAPGEHVLALRLSTYGVAKAGARFTQLLLWNLPPERYRDLDANLRLLPAMAVGAMLTIAIAVFLMWLLADRQRIFILLSALCAGAALLVIVASAPNTWVYPTSWTYLQSAARVILTVIVVSLLLAVTLVHFHPAGRVRWLAAPFILETTLAFSFLPLGFNTLGLILWRSAFLAELGLAGWAGWRRRKGAWLVIAGTVTSWALFEHDPKHFDNTGFLVGFLPVLLALIGAIALRLRSERLEARNTKLTAARLEIELLRKSLQPHFLMNTLTALSQVIEERPAAAVRLIDDLAATFRSMLRFSSEKQISLGEELTLCRAHLGVMSARTELPWSLTSEGVDPNARVPPALFLTLVENGFSHQTAGDDATTFSLNAERVGEGVRYRFFSPGPVSPGAVHEAGGTGLRYVRARLDESFHGVWTLSHGPVPGGWSTVIELGCNGSNGGPR